MPKLPIATSTQQLTTKSSSLKVDPSSRTITGRTLERVGQALSVTSQKFKDLQNLQEYTAASTDAKRRLTELEHKAQGDEDIYTMDQRYGEEIRKVRDDAAKNISDRETQLRFAAEMEQYSMTKEFNIRSISRNKQIDRSKSSLLTDLDQSKNDFYNASSPLERKQLSDSVKNRLDEHARLGVIDEAVSTKMKLAWDDEVRIGQVSYDASINPEMAKKNIEDGVYKLNAKEKEDALNEVAGLVNKREARKKIDLFREFNKKEEEVVDQIVAGKLTVAQVDQMELLGTIGAPGGISGDFATVARRAATSAAAENPKINVDTYNDVLDNFRELRINKKGKTDAALEDLMKFRIKTVKAYKDGDITGEQMQFFLKETGKAYEIVLDKEAKKDLKKSDPTPWNKIYAHTDQYAIDKKEARMRIVDEVMARIKNGESEVDATNAAIKSEARRQDPELSLTDDMPDGVHEKGKPVRNVFDAGSTMDADFEFVDGRLVPVAKGAKK